MEDSFGVDSITLFAYLRTYKHTPSHIIIYAYIYASKISAQRSNYSTLKKKKKRNFVLYFNKLTNAKCKRDLEGLRCFKG